MNINITIELTAIIIGVLVITVESYIIYKLDRHIEKLDKHTSSLDKHIEELTNHDKNIEQKINFLFNRFNKQNDSTNTTKTDSD
jgi:uncharacterized protein YoxC